MSSTSTGSHSPDGSPGVKSYCHVCSKWVKQTTACQSMPKKAFAAQTQPPLKRVFRVQGCPCPHCIRVLVGQKCPCNPCKKSAKFLDAPAKKKRQRSVTDAMAMCDKICHACRRKVRQGQIDPSMRRALSQFEKRNCVVLDLEGLKKRERAGSGSGAAPPAKRRAPGAVHDPTWSPDMEEFIPSRSPAVPQETIDLMLQAQEFRKSLQERSRQIINDVTGTLRALNEGGSPAVPLAEAMQKAMADFAELRARASTVVNRISKPTDPEAVDAGEDNSGHKEPDSDLPVSSPAYSAMDDDDLGSVNTMMFDGLSVGSAGSLLQAHEFLKTLLKPAPEPSGPFVERRVFVVLRDQPGQLLLVCKELMARHVNVTKIQSMERQDGKTGVQLTLAGPQSSVEAVIHDVEQSIRPVDGEVIAAEE